MYLICWPVCCAFRVQYVGMALLCLLSLLYYNVLTAVVSLCRSFVTTELASLATG